MILEGLIIGELLAVGDRFVLEPFCGSFSYHLAKRWEPRGFSRGAAAFSSYDGDLSLPLGLALGSPIFPSGCEGKLGVALESLQGRRDLT